MLGPWLYSQTPGGIGFANAYGLTMRDVSHFLAVSVAPASEPVTTAEAKTHLRVDGTDEDAYIDTLVKAAREKIEIDAERALLPQTLVLRLDRFPGIIELRRCPVTAVSSITYVDTTGATVTLAATEYQTDVSTEPGRIAPAYGKSWPATRDQANAIVVTFTAGYANAAAVPASAKHAIKLLVGHWFRNREAINVGNIVSQFKLSYDALVNSLQWGGYR